MAASPPASPAIGDQELVAQGATGAFAGKDGNIATFTAGGWRFSAPTPGMQCLDRSTGYDWRYGVSGWEAGIIRGSSLEINGAELLAAPLADMADPSGGGTVDIEARGAITEILTILRHHGLIVTGQ
ncbi:DUF2793 domain-containing protein [Sphingomicrobium sediminis]|uniref:DUF2793 domain-containing protein n=1 Tax=Sphingomicrobium sediminis TaxID=2950949 RepID=UPI003CC6B09E